MSKKGELKRKINALRNELDEIESAEAEHRAKALVGRCFKYRNTYGSGGDWWLYAAVTHVEGGRAVGLQFQTDVYGKVEVEIEKHCGLSGFTEIPRKELLAAWDETMALIAKRSPR